MERKVAVKTYLVDYLCDEGWCSGVMKPTGETLLCSPPKYPHKCTVCGTEKTFRLRYPYTEHKEFSLESLG